jgi:hypothetical protein
MSNVPSDPPRSILVLQAIARACSLGLMLPPTAFLEPKANVRPPGPRS